MGPWSEERQYERAKAVQRLLNNPNLDPDARRLWTSVLRRLSKSEAQYNHRVKEVYTKMRNRYTKEWMNE